VLENIRFIHAHFDKRLRRADACDAALVAVFAQAVPYLQKERTVAEGLAALDAFAAADALVFIDGVFKVRVFDVPAKDRVGRTTQIFSRRVEVRTVVMVISAAKQTVAARFVLMHALDRRRLQYALGFATSALRAFVGVDLPEDRDEGIGDRG